jgi:arabinose-5-phosphate isomerase
MRDGEEQPDPLEEARRVLREEADALSALAARLDDAFARAARRIVVTGMGKSGAVGRKIAGTLASTGTPSLFLHPAEAQHGDLGMVTQADIVLALSYSGETDELLAILPALRRLASGLLAITGNAGSTLAEAADITLDVCVAREACPFDLAPTTSTTLMMALGDALAVSVMALRGFGREDYARLHPAGTLGRRLLLRVHDVMRAGAELAVVGESESVHAALFAITRAGAGAACVVDAGGRLAGILTDGDVRRALLENPDALHGPASAAMSRSPRVIRGDPLAFEALPLFERGTQRLGEIPVADDHDRPVGMLMLKDLVRAGLV